MDYDCLQFLLSGLGVRTVRSIENMIVVDSFPFFFRSLTVLSTRNGVFFPFPHKQKYRAKMQLSKIMRKKSRSKISKMNLSADFTLFYSTVNQ
jgi:hypothetical protein